MRTLSNLSWPDTPYGAVGRPVDRPVRLLTGMAMQWADDGTETVPAAAAAVFLPVKRTLPVQVLPDTVHFGFRTAVAEGVHDVQPVLKFVDGILVQGRRDAAGVAWHSDDDLYVMRQAAAVRYPGINAVGEAWKGHPTRERGTAPLIDTTEHLDAQGVIAEVAQSHGIDFGSTLTLMQLPTTAQSLYESLAGDPADTEMPVQGLAAGALAQALAVTLLAGKAMGRVKWDEPFPLRDAVRSVAWHAMPLIFASEGQRPQ